MAAEVVEIKRRRRYGVLPSAENLDYTVPWADAHVEGTRSFKEVELRALQVKLVTEREQWQPMREACQMIDSQRRSTFLYSSEEMETVLLFGMAAGGLSVKETYDLLTGDLGRGARIILGFDQPRNPGWKRERMIRMDGVPSPPSVCRHLKRFPIELRESIWLPLEHAVRIENLSLPENRESLRSQGIDGTTIQTSHTCPIIDPKTGEIINSRSVTCSTGGYVPHTAGPDKSGKGWNLISATTSKRIPTAWDVVLLHDSERAKGAALVAEKLAKEVTPLLEGKSAVLTTDSAFHSSRMRKACQEAGFAPNIHRASHADSESTRENVKRLDKKTCTFPDYPNWLANGHREIRCKCGQGQVSKRFYRTGKGEIIPRVEGNCAKCGSITVTAGDRRLSQNSKFVRCHPSETVAQRDYALGNGLTYHDPVSAAHGKPRFHYQEGLHSMGELRFKLTSKKRRRSVNHVRVEVAMAFTLIHAITIDYYLSRREDEAPPGDLALAA